ncbi:MAG: PASTA domain-containing protein [Edaphobacter sp.]|uniref:PASTA domain-containing protein n=1 Tax=Edaphobacter sp. TaxID=1934404 RepID=UPI00238232FD|nr:PASTA domain-containing protein [Edaphobacter sp.]MDE1176043.1 PASTA domain-containing protein [Edaphobacter sp.]
MKWRAIRRFFNLVLGGLAMITVAMISAFLAMRLAIHGREVKVPDLSHMTISEASRKASSMGLRLQLENKFYSPNTPAGQVLAQFPASGTVVRRQWPVRVTESLGSQQVSVPDLSGQGERSVAINLKRVGLELGTVGQIAVPGPENIVVAQTPPPNAQGIDRPRVSVLMSQSSDAETDSFVMPSLVGLTVSTAFARTGAAGLRIVSAEDVTPTAAPAPVSNQPPVVVAALGPGIVSAQSPLAGHRVTKGDLVRLSVMH